MIIYNLPLSLPSSRSVGTGVCACVRACMHASKRASERGIPGVKGREVLVKKDWPEKATRHTSTKCVMRETEGQRDQRQTAKSENKRERIERTTTRRHSRRWFGSKIKKRREGKKGS